MDDTKAALLRSAITEWRRIAQPIGPQHGYWDLIMDAEAVLSGSRSILTEDQLMRYAREITPSGRGPIGETE